MIDDDCYSSQHSRHFIRYSGDLVDSLSICSKLNKHETTNALSEVKYTGRYSIGEISNFFNWQWTCAAVCLFWSHIVFFFVPIPICGHFQMKVKLPIDFSPRAKVSHMYGLMCSAIRINRPLFTFKNTLFHLKLNLNLTFIT